MKSARRHELQKNDLGEWVAEKLEGLEEHKNTIVTLAIAAVAAVVIGAFLFTGQNAGNALDWQRLYDSYATPNRTRDLESILKNNPKTTAAVLWARKSLADEQLKEGTEKLFVDRQEATELLENAAKNYTEVAQKGSGQSLLLAQAQLGLGRVYESQGDPDKAKKQYAQAIAAAGKDSVFGKVASDAIKRLGDPRTTELLAWFQEQKPKPPKSPLGFDPGTGFNEPLPDRPDIGFPSTPFKNPAKGTPAEEEMPADEGAKPEGDKKETPDAEGDKKEEPAKPAEEPKEKAEPKAESDKP